MTVDPDQKYQEKVEAAANVLCQMIQRDQLNKGHGNITIPDVEEVFMCLATLCYNLCGLILIFLME